MACCSLTAMADEAYQGKVIDTMNAGGYTYVQVQQGDNTFWAAGPQVAVSKGDQVTLAGQSWMKNFTSNTLNRTFDKILFVGKIDKQ
ncbi:NrfJ [Shewanella sp. NIFS-20-20]|uniref:NrfJ n=1 Tax=Shewanella sp. NIFS-20-20 TaxID=2853806 RepID=UPI0021092988|nr:NrfJ [Shewanella sp. NIFS-20-20]